MILMVLFAFLACDNGDGGTTDNSNPDTPPVFAPAEPGGTGTGGTNGGTDDAGGSGDNF